MDFSTMPYRERYLAIATTTLLAFAATSNALTLDFETANSQYGLNEYDPVTTQFAADYGVIFITEAGGIGGPLQLAQIGGGVSDAGGFYSSAGTDTLVGGQPVNMGQYFLGGGPTIKIFNFRMEFVFPTEMVGGWLYDIEGTEAVQISALDANATVLDTLTIDGNTAGAGDGTAVQFLFSRATRDIAALRFVTSNPPDDFLGFGLDNLDLGSANVPLNEVPEPQNALLAALALGVLGLRAKGARRILRRVSG